MRLSSCRACLALQIVVVGMQLISITRELSSTPKAQQAAVFAQDHRTRAARSVLSEDAT